MSEVKAVLTPNLQIEARDSDSPGRKSHIYVVINPDFRMDGVNEPLIVLGRRNRLNRIDHSFLIGQDQLLRGLLFREKIPASFGKRIRNLDLIPVDQEKIPTEAESRRGRVRFLIDRGLNVVRKYFKQ